MLKDLPDWCREVPYQIKSIAVKDACQAVQAAKRKFLITGKVNFVSFRSRKHPVQSCFVPKSAVSENGIYYTVLGQLVMKEELPCEWLDCRLVLRDGRYFLCVPHTYTTHKAENQGRVVGLDPGVRTFLTWFSENSCGKIGSGVASRIFRLALCLDRLCGKTAKAKGHQRQRFKKAQARLRWKIKNLIDEMHWKAARFLCLNFDVILLPMFEVSGMVCKLSRKIKSKTVRKMLTLAHFKFKQRLKFKAFELGKVVLDCNEAYTSKTASWTGEIKTHLGGAKSITSDGITVDRGENGARGIVLRALGDQPWFGKVLPKPAFDGVVTNANKK